MEGAVVLKRFVVAIVAAVGLLIPLMAGPAAASDDLNGPFKTSGRWITDAQGRVFITSGINMVYKRNSYLPAETGFSEDDAQFLADNGFDSVRLGLNWKAAEPQPGVYDDEYLYSLKETAQMLADHGITTMLDFHQDQFNQKYNGQGFPDWATIDHGFWNWPVIGFGTDYIFNFALKRAFDSFWFNEPGPGGVGLQERFAAMWGHVAGIFADTPALLGYDLMNEPMPGSEIFTCFFNACPKSTAGLSAAQDKAAKAIRAASPEGIVFYEPFSTSNGGFLWVITGPAPDVNNRALSFHSYCLIANATKTQEGCDWSDQLGVDLAAMNARSAGSALILTEWGAMDDIGIINAHIDLAARNLIGQQEWAYCGCDDPTTADLQGQALVNVPSLPPTGTNVRWEKLKGLAVPHPRLVAGTPTKYGINRDTGVFTLKYKTKRVTGGTFNQGTSVIAVPAINYPDGYVATVKGGTVTSADNALELTVKANPGVSKVKVKVAPRQGLS